MGAEVQMLPQSFSPATRSHCDVLITNHKRDSGVTTGSKGQGYNMPYVRNRSPL